MRSEGRRERQGIWVAIVTAPQLRREGEKSGKLRTP